MIVTINTDASFSHKHKRGSFAFWIVCDRFKILKSGILRKEVSRSELAEFRCIVNALHVLLNEDVSDIHKIIINTDCLNVIHLMNKDKAKIYFYNLGSWGNHLVQRIEIMFMKKKLNTAIIEMRHVKAHTNNSDARSYVNDWCDKAAKAQLNKFIKQ